MATVFLVEIYVYKILQKKYATPSTLYFCDLSICTAIFWFFRGNPHATKQQLMPQIEWLCHNQRVPQVFRGLQFELPAVVPTGFAHRCPGTRDLSVSQLPGSPNAQRRTRNEAIL